MLLIGLLPVDVAAHDFTITESVVLLKSDGTFLIDMTVDVDALALGVSPATPSAEVVQALAALSVGEFEVAHARAIDTIQRRVRVRFDDQRVIPDVVFPEIDSPLLERYEVPSLMGATARLTGRIPEGAKEFKFGASRSFQAVQLTLVDGTSVAIDRYLLEPGADSPPWIIGAPGESQVDRRGVIGDYLVLGFEHIVPLGLDHILFVLGLFLLSARPRPLLWQISAFTVAHTLTLGLSMLGWISLPSRPVEVLIALSIAYVAIENLFTTELKPWRPALVFGFGLLHGLGFAGVLRELGLPEGEFVAGLISFNVGVEFGQLAVVAAAFLAVGWFRDRPWYRRRVVLPASLAIAALGLFWAVERMLG